MTISASDVVVIGGGLAGCSAAITLAQSGHNVVLSEAKSYPNHKVCGEFMSPHCTDHLRALGVLDAVMALRPAMIDKTRITTPDGRDWQAALPGHAIGISRYALDALLVQRAQTLGVRVLDNTTITDINGSLDRGFTLNARSGGAAQTLHARCTIAAYGKRSGLDRTLNRHFLGQKHPYVGLKNHFIGTPLPASVDLHSFAGGYCGISEIENGMTNVCLLVRQDVFQAVSGGDIAVFIAWMRQQNPALEAWLSQAHPVFERWLSISQIPFTRKTALEQDVLMTGDAAGLIAPLAGDGMEMALRGGRLAAAATAAFLTGGWSAPQLRETYPNQWRTAFSPRLRLGRLLQAVMLRPVLLSAGLRIVQQLPALGHFFIRQTRDTQPSLIVMEQPR